MTRTISLQKQKFSYMEVTKEEKRYSYSCWHQVYFWLIDNTIGHIKSYLFWNNVKKYYRHRTGQKLDFNNPKNINEKLWWLTRYWQHPLKTKCADKYLVREYVTERGLQNILIPLIAVYNNANEIDFEVLPKSFIFKCNHGCGYNIIVDNKDTIDQKSIKQQLQKWLSISYDSLFYEIHYKDIPRKIVCEELISTTAPIEYQCWCINGNVDSLLVCRKNHDGTYDSWSYSILWEQLYERIKESHDKAPKPQHLKEILLYAKILSAPFPFVRADFYEVNGKIYFAELTFTPCGNVLSNYKEPFLQRTGNNLVLPPKYKRKHKK